jgi:hypothetical protein
VQFLLRVFAIAFKLHDVIYFQYRPLRASLQLWQQHNSGLISFIIARVIKSNKKQRRMGVLYTNSKESSLYI